MADRVEQKSKRREQRLSRHSLDGQQSLFERQQVDSHSDDSVLRAINYMQRFLTRAKATTLSDEQHERPFTHDSGKEERKDTHEKEESKEEERPVADENEDEVELRRLMDELARRPELISGAAEKDTVEEETDEERNEPHSSPPATPSRLLPLAGRMRQESELFASRRRPRPPLSSSASLAPSAASSSYSSFSLLSAAERRLCSRRLSSLQRALADEARQRRSTRYALQARMADEQRRRRAALQRVESSAVERAVAAAMGRNRRDERELERMVAEQADRVRQLIGMKTEGMRQYYREQLSLVHQEMGRQDEERRVQDKVSAQ